MDIFQRIKMYQIESINVRDLQSILTYSENSSLPKIDSVVFDNILLTNGVRLQCIKKYYKRADGSVPRKGKANNTCVAIKKFFDIKCNPYDCVKCHRDMLNKRANNDVSIM